MNLFLRIIGTNDFAVIDGGVGVGRIRHAAERTNDIWMWNVTIPGPPSGVAADLDQAKAAFRNAYGRFKTAIGAERLADAIECQDNANSRRRL